MELDPVCKEVVEKTEWIAIVTSSDSGPHLVGAWGYRLRQIGIRDGVIVLPAGKYNQTEANLRKNPRVQLLMAAADIPRTDGKQGHGYRIAGQGAVETTGRFADAARTAFPWARGALVIKMEQAESLLP